MSYLNVCFRVKSPGLNNVWNTLPLVGKDCQEFTIFSVIKFSVNVLLY